jgi:metal-responsive CopG/Arc/MetJ family transcriptional regulator
MDIKFQDTIRIGVNLPRPLVEAIDSLAEKELLARATWVRRALLNSLKDKKVAA